MDETTKERLRDAGKQAASEVARKGFALWMDALARHPWLPWKLVRRFRSWRARE